MDRQMIDIQIDRCINRQTDDRQTRMDRQIYKQIDTDRQIDTDGWIDDRQIDRQIDKARERKFHEFDMNGSVVN